MLLNVFWKSPAQHHFIAVPQVNSSHRNLSVSTGACWLIASVVSRQTGKPELVTHDCTHRLLEWPFSTWLQVIWWRDTGTISVCDRQTFPVLRSTCNWWVTTYVGKPSATGQPIRPTQPFIISRSINWVVSCNRMFDSSHGWRRLVNAYGVEAWCGWLERWCVC